MSLQKGDLILYPVVASSAFIDKLIGMAEFSMGMDMTGVQYCHCAIYADNEMTYEARWPQTGKYRLDRSRPFEAYRINGITQFQIDEMMEWAQDHEGEIYDIPALLTAGFFRLPHAEVCSTFMADCLAWAKIIKTPEGFTKPDQILQMVSTTRIMDVQ